MEGDPNYMKSFVLHLIFFDCRRTIKFAFGPSNVQLLDLDLNLASCVTYPWPCFSSPWSLGWLPAAGSKYIDRDVSSKK